MSNNIDGPDDSDISDENSDTSSEDNSGDNSEYGFEGDSSDDMTENYIDNLVDYIAEGGAENAEINVVEEGEYFYGEDIAENDMREISNYTRDRDGVYHINSKEGENEEDDLKDSE